MMKNYKNKKKADIEKNCKIPLLIHALDQVNNLNIKMLPHLAQNDYCYQHRIAPNESYA